MKTRNSKFFSFWTTYIFHDFIAISDGVSLSGCYILHIFIVFDGIQLSMMFSLTEWKFFAQNLDHIHVLTSFRYNSMPLSPNNIRHADIRNHLSVPKIWQFRILRHAGECGGIGYGQFLPVLNFPSENGDIMKLDPNFKKKGISLRTWMVFDLIW